MPKNAVYDQDITEIKLKFQHIASELDAIKNDSYRDAETLERLKQTLDINYVNNLIKTLESLEKRVKKADDEARDVTHKMEEYKDELGREGTRLEKLWDAYKKQESELSQKEDTLHTLENQITTLKQKHRKYEEGTSELQSLKKDRERMKWLESELEKQKKGKVELQETVHQKEKSLLKIQGELKELQAYVPYKKQVEEMDKRIKELEPLQGYTKYKKRTEELEKLCTQEQERLAKLYKIYEDTTIELGDVKKELEHWRTWYQDNKEYLDMASRAVKNLKTPEGLLH